jgi:hypothetical protein
MLMVVPVMSCLGHNRLPGSPCFQYPRQIALLPSLRAMTPPHISQQQRVQDALLLSTGEGLSARLAASLI